MNIPAITADPQAKADWLTSTFGQRFQALLDEAGNMVDNPQGVSLDRRALRLIEISKEVASRVAPMTPCGKGCSHCCNQATTISRWEADRISKFNGRKHANPPGINPLERSRESLVDQYSGVPCPFLKNGNCTIYAVRPLPCIDHHSLWADPSVCDIANKGAPIPGFNQMELTFTQAALFFNEGVPFADIREFFP